MNIPSIPTDNLYKFLAIFGLVVFSIGIYLQKSTYGSELEHSISLLAETKKWKTEVESVDDAQGTFDSELKSLQGQVKEFNIDQKMLDRLTERLYNDLKNIENDRKKIQFLKTDLDELKERGDLLEAENKYIDNLATGLQGGAAFFILIGFVLWHLMHQRYIDAEIEWKGRKFMKLLKDAKDKENEGVIDTVVDDSESQEEELD